jgi:mannose-6-phosphate isomerase-like protein (cupin superfamily)
MPRDVYRLGPAQTLTVVERGGSFVVDAAWEPSGTEPPYHLHPAQDEHFDVLEGELTVRVAGEQRTLRAGDTLDVPRETPHAVWNAADAPARARWTTMPAGRTEDWFAIVDGVGRGTVDGSEMPRHLEEFADTFRLA